MSAGAMIFMALSWTFVLGLTIWSFAKILQKQRHFDPDGIGPASPPVPPSAPSHGEPRGR